MAEIPKDFGQGGAHLTPEGSGTPALKTILDDIADDLGSRSGIASPDAVVAAGAAPDKAEFDAVVLLVNEIKAAMNVTVKTTKEA